MNIPESDILTTLTKELEDWRTGAFLPDECQDCADKSRCNGGCRMHAFHCYGKAKGKDPRMTEPVSPKMLKGKNKHIVKCDVTPGARYKIKKYIKYRKETDSLWSVFSGDYYDILNDEAMTLFKYYFINANWMPRKIDSKLKSFVQYFLVRNYIDKVYD